MMHETRIKFIVNFAHKVLRFTSTNFKPSNIGFVNFPFLYHEEITVRIDDLNNMGIGVAKYDLSARSSSMMNAPASADRASNLWTIFVPISLPGEICKVRIFKNYPNYSEADLGMVIAASYLTCNH